MVAKVAFEVVAEFVFEEALALTATNALTKSLGSLSAQADNAIFGVARIGQAYATAFLTGGGGIIGLIGGAIKASEKFRSTQIELANTMLSNRFTVNGEVIKFNQALKISDGLLLNINEKARGFGLSTSSLVQATKIFANFLAPKGLAGDNLENAIDLARVSVKGVPALGIDQTNAQQQIASGIGGQLSKQTLFGSRLFAEAGDAIKSVTGGLVKDIKSFNAAKPDVRVKALIAGLNKLAGTADIVDARAKLLSSRLIKIRDLLVGVGSVLKPLGDSITAIIGPILDQFASQIQSKGPKLVKLLNIFFKGVGESPKQLFLTLKNFSSLNSDIEKAGNLLRALSISIALLGFVAFIPGVRALTVAMLRMGGVVRFITLSWLRFSRIFTGILGKGILGRLLLLIPNFALLVAAFQIMSRAASKLQLQFVSLIDVFANRFIKQVQRLTILLQLMFEPFNFIIDLFSDLIVSATNLTGTFNSTLNGFKLINDGLQLFTFVLQGVFIFLKSIGAFLGGLFGTLATGFESPQNFLSGDFLKSIFTNSAQAFTDEMNKGVDGVVQKILDPDKSDKTIAKNKIDVKIDNTFNIREKIEPDRIAFTMQDQLKKLSENRRSVVGRPLIASGV